MALMGWWAWILAGARMPGMFAEKQERSKGRTNLTLGHVSQSWNSTGPAAGADERLKVHLPDSLKWIKNFVFKVSTVPFQAQARKRTKRKPEKKFAGVRRSSSGFVGADFATWKCCCQKVGKLVIRMWFDFCTLIFPYILGAKTSKHT